MHKISIIMGIYNCAPYLDDAIQSIIDQTYENWELILCDDGSTDNTYIIAKKYSQMDSRIVVIKNTTNLGLNKTLNKCISLSTGDYIARMDGDDLSLPERLEKEVQFLESNPGYAIVGCPMILFDENGDYGINKAVIFPQAEDVVCGSPISHATVIMRKQALLDIGGYSELKKTLRVEDVDLWIKMYAAGYKAYNLQQPLYKMRNDRNAYSRRKYRYRVNSVRVRLNGCKLLHLPFGCYCKSIKPMIIGCVPNKMRRIIKNRIGRKNA